LAHFYFLGVHPPSRLSPNSRTNRQELAYGVLNRAILSYQVPWKLLQASFNLVSDCGGLSLAPFGEEGGIARQERKCGVKRIYAKGRRSPSP